MTQLIAFDVEYDGPCKLAGTAILDAKVKVGKDCNIGHYVYVMEDTILGKEVILDYLVRTGERCKIGDHTIIKTKATISPDCVIGKNVFIGPHALLLHAAVDGEHSPAMVEDGAYIGSGAIIMPGVTVGENAIVGAGAIVTKDVPANVTVMGNPAKEYNKED